MATFVLVHGAWLGGWVWGRVAADLRGRGHTVYAPTLTGLGERVHLLDDDVDLEFHATDVCNTLEFEDAQRAILVGHGYGGAVVQRVAARAAARVGRLFFLDALLAPDGASLFDALGPDAAAALRARAADEDGVAVLTPDLGLLLDGLAKRDADWVEDRLAPMPALAYEERPDLAAFFALERPSAYVKCQRGDPAASVELAHARGWTVHEIDGGHLPMIARPAPTAELLDNFARQPGARFGRGER